MSPSVGPGPEVSHYKPCLCLLFCRVQRKNILLAIFFFNTNPAVNTLLQASVSDVVPLVPASHSSCSLPPLPQLFRAAGSNAEEKHHYLFSFKVQLCRAENETPIAGEANALLIIDPDVAWILFSMWVCQEARTPGREK